MTFFQSLAFHTAKLGTAMAMFLWHPGISTKIFSKFSAL